MSPLIGVISDLLPQMPQVVKVGSRLVQQTSKFHFAIDSSAYLSACWSVKPFHLPTRFTFVSVTDMIRRDTKVGIGLKVKL